MVVGGAHPTLLIINSGSPILGKYLGIGVGIGIGV